MAQIIPHNRLTFGESEWTAVATAVRSGQWAQGPRVLELETELARLAGVRHAVAVGSGLGAVRLALGALRVRAGDSIAVPAYSCVALANAVLSWGARVVPLEIEPRTWTLDSKKLELPTELRAVIAVNTFGAPACFTEIRARGIPVLEDCAHAFGLSSEDGALGGRGDLGVLSFYATKLIGGGEGGAVLTNSEDLAQFVRNARDYSDQPPDGHRLNDKMNDLEASLVLAQLRRLPDMINRRQEIAHRYIQAFSEANIQSVYRLPKLTSRRVWYRFAVEMVCTAAAKVIDDLADLGVQAAIPVNDWRPPDSPPCPVADRAYSKLVSLPAYPSLTDQEQQVVIESFVNLGVGYARA